MDCLRKSIIYSPHRKPHPFSVIHPRRLFCS